MALGAKLKELRLRKGQSLQQVADAVGSSKAHIWELETGKSKNPSIELLTKLAENFDVSVAYLIGEAPGSPDEEPELIAMYRDFKGLAEADRATIAGLIKMLKARKKEKSEEN